MDHLCPRLSFPLAPCLQCLSGPAPCVESKQKPTRRTNFIESMVFPSPPRTKRSSSRNTALTKPADKRSRRPKLSLQTRLPSIPQSQVIEELSVSFANFVLQQNDASQRQSRPTSVRAMRKDSATAPWLEPIEQVRT